MTKVRFISAVPALTYDPHLGAVKVIVSVDADGGRWQSINDGPDVPIPSPEKPAKRQQRQRSKPSKL